MVYITKSNICQNPQLRRSWREIGLTVDCDAELQGIDILQWLGIGIFFCSSVLAIVFCMFFAAGWTDLLKPIANINCNRVCHCS